MIKEKIDEFYNLIDEREYHYHIYESVAGYIINERLKDITEKYLVSPKFTDIAVPWVGVHISIQYSNMRTGSGTLVLTHDLLYRKLGHSQERHNIRSYTIVGYRILTTNDKFFEVSEEEFMTLWENAIADSDKNETLQYLRESVETVRQLGTEILKRIDEL